ncbi:MAG TPA: HAMP domain-containing sensor histidine kinase [Bacillota bacterium]|nr:HAMP domain-containing sensor histidine kinase [Bacillota bacterium]
MKLFIKDHLSFVIFYIVAAIGLPMTIHVLDRFENHFIYYVVLMMILLASFLVIRYLRRKKMYDSLATKQINNDLPLHDPLAPVEKSYDKKMQDVQSYMLERERAHKQFADEQQLLISHAVHQMKTPLSVIQLLIQTNERTYPQMMQEWTDIQTECHKLNVSLNQLLTYSRSHELLADVKIERVSLKEMVQEVINDLKAYFIERHMFPKVTSAEDTFIYTDRKWMKVVIYQLLNNAIKYGYEQTTIEVAFDDEALTVKNEGKTIDKSDIKRVFDLFYTGIKGRESGEATGIGLYLVKRILETLDCSYDLKSAEEVTRFTVHFSKQK